MSATAIKALSLQAISSKPFVPAWGFGKPSAMHTDHKEMDEPKWLGNS